MATKNATRVQKTTEMIDRIEQIRKHFGQSRLAFSGTLGVSSSNYANMIARGSKPNAEILTAIAERTDANLKWLLTGQGSMLEPQTGFLDHKGEAHPDLGERFALVPRISHAASAGPGGEQQDPEAVIDVYAFREDWIRQRLRASPEDFVAMNVAGDSMDPTLRNGDLILVYKEGGQIKYDAIYVVRLAESIVVKRVQRQADGSVDLVSDNPAYRPMTIKPADQANGVQVIGRVMWYGRQL